MKFIQIEWADNDIHVFTEALEKFPDDWTQIANYVRRSEQSCRAFYQQYRKKNGLVDDERVSRCFANGNKKAKFFFCFGD